jgi:hypothetical protein
LVMGSCWNTRDSSWIEHCSKTSIFNSLFKVIAYFHFSLFGLVLELLKLSWYTPFLCLPLPSETYELIYYTSLASIHHSHYYRVVSALKIFNFLCFIGFCGLGLTDFRLWCTSWPSSSLVYHLDFHIRDIVSSTCHMLKVQFYWIWQ